MRLAIAVLLSSGCSVVITYGGPKKQVVRHVTRTERASIRSVPEGATVSDRTGPPRTTPTELEASYEVELVHRERRELYPILGIGAAAATMGVGALMLRGEDHRVLSWTVMILGIVDVVSYPNRFASFRRANERARNEARERPIRRSLELDVRWPDARAEVVKLDWPQRHVTIVPTPPTTFDETLIAWAEAAERTPSPEGLWNLGSAYAARATSTGAAEDARKALDYFDRYLQTAGVPDARRARVEELRRSLRGDR